jgi:hypothetical protein
MAQRGLNFLQNVLNDILNDVPLARRRDMWFLYDGIPPHCSSDVTECLNNNFEEKWISRYGPFYGQLGGRI